MAAALALFAEAAWATRLPGPDTAKNDWFLGGSFAAGFHPGASNGVAYGADVTFVPKAISPVWVGGGVRLFDDLTGSNRIAYPYLEGGIWFLLNFGLGYSFDARDPFATPLGGSGPHVFVGLPLPVSKRVYVQPYYRVAYVREDAFNEAGILLKWTTLRL